METRITNQSKLEDAKRGKTGANNKRLVLPTLLIGRKNGVRIIIQSKYSKERDTHLSKVASQAGPQLPFRQNKKAQLQHNGN